MNRRDAIKAAVLGAMAAPTAVASVPAVVAARKPRKFWYLFWKEPIAVESNCMRLRHQKFRTFDDAKLAQWMTHMQYLIDHVHDSPYRPMVSVILHPDGKVTNPFPNIARKYFPRSGS